MTKPGTSDAGRQLLRFLLVGGSQQDFADLQQCLARSNADQLHLEHATSPEDVLAQIGKESYDLLLCSNQSTDNAAFQLLRQVRQHYSGVPLLFLSYPVNKDVIQAAMEAQVPHHAARRSDLNSAVPNSSDKRFAERQRLDSEETLRKLWRSVEQMADALIIMNRSGVMEYVRLADERPDMKVLFVSGYAENTVLRHGKIDVVTRFLEKPFSLKALAKKVREVLDASGSLALTMPSRG